ncbi:hypothetical protein ANN_01189 [Periplaneta americana]|uniref:Tc1-like transposase DDE domain-containing protein n=1 Tax=Periplaneta americana TaxID=6978 RepID=A0ABQ8TSX4_PERAM|nr:hypothetical protein ANN_01189 [Periplaneta americana]
MKENTAAHQQRLRITSREPCNWPKLSNSYQWFFRITMEREENVTWQNIKLAAECEQQFGWPEYQSSSDVKRKEIPTLRKLLNAVKEKIQFNGGKDTFWRLLRLMGYKFKKCKNMRHVLMERSDIVARSTAYLRMLKLNEKGPKKPIVYTDETWVRTHYTVNKCWQHDEVQGVHVNQSIGQRAIVVHANSEMGFIEGAELIYDSKSQSADYHDEMNGEKYNKRLKERPIPNLPSECIVVLDNALYHTVQENKVPAMACRKSDIISWLKNQNLTADLELTKWVLIETVKLQAVYRILKEHGFTVPPYHCDLNPKKKTYLEFGETKHGI